MAWLVNVNIEGKLHKKIPWKKIENRFRGTINIEGEELPEDVDTTRLDMLFADDGSARISYPQPKYNENGIRSSWSAENGQMITAPASSRSEAINITNEITEKRLRGFKLK